MSSNDEAPSSPPKSPVAGTSPSSATSSSCATCGKGGEVSPVASSASTKARIDDNSSNIEFIQKFLECSICLDFPASPIHSCANAHFLCGQCAPKFSACPTCKNPKLNTSPACEKLAKEANKKLDCANLEAGCKEGVLSTKFPDHLTSCYFREITCNYGTYDVNCGVKVKFHEYTKHLEDVHKEKIRIGPKIRETYLYDEKKHDRHRIVLYQWGHAVTKFEGHEFIVDAKVSKQRQQFFSWVSVLGDEDLADNYICKVKVKSLNEFGCTWKLPVLAFHEIPTNPPVAKLFEYSEGLGVSAFPMAALRKWGILEGDKIIPIEVTYEIKNA